MSTVIVPFSRRRLWGHLETSNTISSSVPRWLSALGLCITLAGCCAGDFRFTDLGPRIQSGIRGYPFIYEIGVALVCLGSAVTLISSGGHLKSKAFSPICGILAFYVPIFTNALLVSPNIYELFIGSGALRESGALRLQLEAMLFGISLLLVPLTPKVHRLALGVIVSGAVLNAVANLLYVAGLAVPLSEPFRRGMTGALRYGGLFQFPAHVGMLSALGVVAICSVTKHRFWRTFAIALCIVSTGLADSRTGFAGIVFGLGAVWLYSRRLSVTDRVIAIVTLLFATLTVSTVILGAPAIRENIVDTERGRISGVLTVIANFSHHPMGTAWGLFADVQSNSNYSGGVDPHNWPAMALLYGGIISFTVVVAFHLSLIRSWVSGASRQDCKEWRKVPLALLITCVVCSWFEQAFQTPITLFTFFLALAALSAPPSEGTASPSIGQLIRPTLSERGSRRTFRRRVRAKGMGFAVGKREPHGASSL